MKLSRLPAYGASDIICCFTGAISSIALLAHHHMTTRLIHHARIQIKTKLALVFTKIFIVLSRLNFRFCVHLFPLLRVVFHSLRDWALWIYTFIRVGVQSPTLTQMKLYLVFASGALFLSAVPELIVFYIERVLAFVTIDKCEIRFTSWTGAHAAGQILTIGTVGTAPIWTAHELEFFETIIALLHLAIIEIFAMDRFSAIWARNIISRFFTMTTFDFLSDFLFFKKIVNL